MTTLSQFPRVMDRCVRAVIVAAEALRRVRDGTGDLSIRDLHAIQQGLRSSKYQTYQVLTEAAKAVPAAEAYMASVNGPATIAAFQAQAVVLETAAAAWNARLDAMIATLTGPEVIGLVVRNFDGVQTKDLTFASVIPETKAAPLRASTELAALIAEFEVVGA
ncbi:hypothetical protein [Pukyongiella litopenaei]|uniref:Uncharacterized protein n=1 Tax=Pukyongiella litopenaei TaxID=2605946 RepID=A0A2S0ML36_9RHOB|nr:hypothetical protein [Pukyongiella litopenaei]AVO36589.1 hypothetical protein C6Y53_01990 [Pukyongiella litopenaei]